MNTFKDFINEAQSIIRYLKHNKKLTDDEKEKINDFFVTNKQASRDFEKQYGWQSKAPREMTWDEFQHIMGSSKFGRRLLLKSTKIPGSKGKDYWPMKLKNKNFIANIPLNQETAQFMNSCQYGTISVKYCIGWSSDKRYWDTHVIKERKVPIYISDGVYKWVVMIKSNNKTYEVWDKFNNRDLAKNDKEPIPNFSIKKELIGSAQAKLYDEIREEHYGVGKLDKEDAIVSYKKMVDDILTFVRQRADDEEYWYREMERIKDSTAHQYEEWAYEAEEEAEEKAGELKSGYKHRAESIKKILKVVPNGTGVNKYGEPIWTVSEVDYTRNELEAYIDTYEKELKNKNREPDYSERDRLQAIADDIREMSVYDMIEYDQSSSWDKEKYPEIEWVETPYEYEESYDLYYPDAHHSDYEDYFNYLENTGNLISLDDAFMYIYDLSDGGSWETVDREDVENWLAVEDMPHPNDIDE
jgi:hypothetical protein